MKIGPVLKMYRTKARLDGRELALKAGLQPSYLSRMENDKLPIRLDHLEIVCKALGVPMWKVIQSAEEYSARVEPAIESLGI